jgi:hypothetical protein
MVTRLLVILLIDACVVLVMARYFVSRGPR